MDEVSRWGFPFHAQEANRYIPKSCAPIFTCLRSGAWWSLQCDDPTCRKAAPRHRMVKIGRSHQMATHLCSCSPQLIGKQPPKAGLLRKLLPLIRPRTGGSDSDSDRAWLLGGTGGCVVLLDPTCKLCWSIGRGWVHKSGVLLI